MEKNKKIIISITGILIVTLALIGITYAYFATQIKGNSNDKSVVGKLGTLELTYKDKTENVLNKTMKLGDTITKEFTVENTGTKKVEDYVIVLENVTNELTRKQDLVYNLECSSGGIKCNGVEEKTFPSARKVGIVVNDIEPKEIQTYKLTLT